MSGDIRIAKNDCPLCGNLAKHIKILLSPIYPDDLNMADRFCTECLTKAPIKKWDAVIPSIAIPLEHALTALSKIKEFTPEEIVPITTIARNLMRGFNYPAINKLFNNFPTDTNPDVIYSLLRTTYIAKDYIESWEPCRAKFNFKIGTE